MALNDIFQMYQTEALKLGENVSEISKLDLANGYCDAEEAGDEALRSQYWSALMVRYWFKIFKWMRESSSCKLQPEDFVSWLEHALYVAFYYRSWRWEYEAVVKHGKFIEWKLDENGNRIKNEHYYKVDPNAADRSINYFCSAQRGLEYQKLNRDKQKAAVFTDSLDSMIENVGYAAYDAVTGLAVEDETSDIKDLVKSFLAKHQLLEALIIDGVAYQNTFKENRVALNLEDDPEDGIQHAKFKTSYEFSERLLVNHLKTIDSDFIENYFKPNYEAEDLSGEELLEEVQTASNAQLKRFIHNTFKNMQKRRDLLQHICA